MSEGRYSSMSVIKALEFSSVFHGCCRVSVKKVLTCMTRDRVALLAATLNRLYCNKEPGNIVYMLSAEDKKRFELIRRVTSAVENDAKRGYEDVVAFDIAPLEILRIAFSLNPYSMREEPDADINKIHWALVKGVTQINEDLMLYTINKKDDLQVAKLIMVNSASYNDVLKDDKDAYLYQVTQSFLFFKLLERTPKYQGLLNAFYDYFGIKSWKEYVRTVYSIALMSFREDTGVLRKTIETDPPGMLSLSVLNRLSIDVNNEVFPYSSKDEFDRDGNSDFRQFKSRPLLRLSDGNYVIHNTRLLIDRLFCSLYFDFQSIDEKFEEKHPDVSGLFTEMFAEKTMFAGFLNDCLQGRVYDSFEEKQLKKIYKIKDGEAGYPDFYLRNKSANTAILFECKDIRLNAWIKGKRDYSVLEEELRNKIVVKKYKLDNEKKCRVSVEPKRIGVGQLAAHAVNMRKGLFPWDKELPVDCTIYPVLVIADNRLLFDGLPYLAQHWYEERLKVEGGEINSSRPLIMMSPLTLLKYKPLFIEKGFEYYFEAYYSSLKAERTGSIVDVINSIISFDDYMNQFSFSLEDLRIEIMETLYTSEGFKSMQIE